MSGHGWFQCDATEENGAETVADVKKPVSDVSRQASGGLW